MEKLRFDVRGIQLTEKEKQVYDLISENGTVSANELVGKVNYSVHSIRATLARLSKTHALLNEGAKLEGAKAVKTYSVSE
jgi:predicted HTH transcriptional regulator